MTSALPDGLRSVMAEVRHRLGASERGLADRFDDWFPATWTRALDPSSGTVLTGDIPAMWPRDTAAQVRPYLAAAHDPEVAAALVRVARRVAGQVESDPWANAFTVAGHRRPVLPIDLPRPSSAVWERKHEVDTGGAALRLVRWVHDVTGHDDLAEVGAQVATAVVRTWRIEQDHDLSPYRFVRLAHSRLDRIGRAGRGRPVARTGMPWCGFRPSDDACALGYHVPSSMLAVVALRGVRDWCTDAGPLADEIEHGIETHARIVGPDGSVIYAYEVDGLGSSVLMDEANLPSLVAIPVIGYRSADDPTVTATRRFALSPANPWFVNGSVTSGIGSPHTGPGTVWPLGWCALALSSPSADEAWSWLRRVVDHGTRGSSVLESVHADDPRRATRPWFGWATALAAEVVMALVGIELPGAQPAWS